MPIKAVQHDFFLAAVAYHLERAGTDGRWIGQGLGILGLGHEVLHDRIPDVLRNQVDLGQGRGGKGRIGSLEGEADLAIAGFFDFHDVTHGRLVHRHLVAHGRGLEGIDHIVDGDRLAVVPVHACAQRDVHRSGIDPFDFFSGPGLRQPVGPDARKPVPHQFGHPGTGRTRDIHRADGHHRLGRVEDHLLLFPLGRGPNEGPEVADAYAALGDDRILRPDVLVEGFHAAGVDQEHLRLVAVEQALRLAHEGLALFRVGRLALVFRHLVIFGIDVADKVEAGGGGGGVVVVEHHFVRIAALGSPDHAPHGGVPFFAFVPDHLDMLLPRQGAHLHIQAELAPGLGHQLRSLISLRVDALGPGDQNNLANRVARCLSPRRGMAEQGHGQKQRHRDKQPSAKFMVHYTISCQVDND